MRLAVTALAMLLAAPVQAQDAANPLDGFSPLIGNCYETATADGGVDRQCWSETSDGQGIRQEQVYRGGSLDGQTAEAIYEFDEVSGEASFSYRASTGYASFGSLELEGDTIVFPDEIYRLADGSKGQMYSTFRIVGPDLYVSEFRSEYGGMWSEEFRYEFRRVDRSIDD